MTFESFNLYPGINSGIAAMGYKEPTPIQEQAIPAIMKNMDVMGMAQTGTGKTAAFVLPILQRLSDGPDKRVRALIITPTRELSEQIHKTVLELGRNTGIKSTTVYGGVNRNAQIKSLRSGVGIVVGCPGRILDLLGERIMDLSHMEILVLDEADRMFDMGFLPDIKRIINCVPAERQTLLFSATMPDDVRMLASSILRDPVTVQIGRLVPVESVSHAIYPVDQYLKTPLLIRLLRGPDLKSILVFTRTKDRATRLAKQLKRSGFRATSLQGNLSQSQRQHALDGFRRGKYKILVATDIAARGIDISSISHVINYDMPDTVEAYTHRIGRTGRAAMSGIAFSFVVREERAFVWHIEKAIREKLEIRTLSDFDYTALPPAGTKAFSRKEIPSRPGHPRRAPARRRTLTSCPLIMNK